VREWTDRYGTPPRTSDWNSTRAHHRGGEALSRRQTRDRPPASIDARFDLAVTDALARR